MALQHALEDMSDKEANTYYFAQIKKALHDIGISTLADSERLFALWDKKYTLDDYEPSLYRYLIAEVLICYDYSTFKRKLIEDDPSTEPKNTSVMQALQQWKQAKKEEKYVDYILADDFKKLWQKVWVYQKTILSEGNIQYTSSPLTPPSASMASDPLYKKYSQWLLYSSIFILSMVIIWLARYMKKRKLPQGNKE